MARAIALLLCAGLAPALMASGAGRYRVTLALRPGDDLQIVIRQLAGTYRLHVEPAGAAGVEGFVMTASEASVNLLSRDERVTRVEPAATPVAVPEPQQGPTPMVNWNAGVSYTYDAAGNIRQIGTDRFVYDHAGRLVQANVNGVQRNYEYDAFGNRTRCTQPVGDCQFGAVDTLANKNRIATGTYDASGNVTDQAAHRYSYDGVNMQTRDEFGTVAREYIYTADDERIAIHNVGSSWEWTVRDTSGKVLREFTSQGDGTTGWAWVKDYVWRDGLLLASRQSEAGSTTTYHYHLDHLGTPRRITNDFDETVGHHDYFAFGPETSDSRHEPSIMRMKYTGHERDLSLSGSATDRLDYMHARFYNPNQGRFLSVDPVLDVKNALQNPQMWNRYAYVRNNPINKIDPNGKYEEDVHRGLTEVLALAAGFDEGSAMWVAAANQGVDLDPVTQPFASHDARANYHFTTQARRGSMWGDFERFAGQGLTVAYSALGQFLHAQQDSYSHAGFGPDRGHLSAGHAPDRTFNDPAKAMRMAHDTYSRLTAAADKLGIDRSNRVAWNAIRGLVVKFTLARTEKDKDKYLQQLRDTIAAAQ